MGQRLVAARRRSRVLPRGSVGARLRRSSHRRVVPPPSLPVLLFPVKVGGNASLLWCAVRMFLIWLPFRALITRTHVGLSSRRLRHISRLNTPVPSTPSLFSSIVIIMIQWPSPLLDSPFLYKALICVVCFGIDCLPFTASLCLSSLFCARIHAARITNESSIMSQYTCTTRFPLSFLNFPFL